MNCAQSQPPRPPSRVCLTLDRVTKLVNEANYVNNVFEAVVVTCSDTQILTGLAFGASTHFQECTISAYHYNIVEDLLLMTCATHMVTFSAVRSNFRLFWPSLIRIACVLTVYGLLGSLLGYQTKYGTFPQPNLTWTIAHPETLMWPAACPRTLQGAK